MGKTIVTKYGTKINVDGLSGEQIARVRSMAEDNGPYGKKGAALADSFRKGKGGKSGGSRSAKPASTLTNAGDFNNPDNFWTKVPKIYGQEDLEGGIQQVQDANYNYITKDYANQETQELEAAKQELANRGIPLDPNPNSLYGRTIAQIQNKWQGARDQARNQAIAGGDQSLQTRVGASATANQAFLQGWFGLSDQELKRYGIDKDYSAKMAAIRKTRSGGGGGGGGGGGDIITGRAPGY